MKNEDDHIDYDDSDIENSYYAGCLQCGSEDENMEFDTCIEYCQNNCHTEDEYDSETESEGELDRIKCYKACMQDCK